MATKKTSRKRAASEKSPSGPEEFLTLNNATATQSLPKELADAAERLHVTVHAPGTELEARKMTRSEERPGSWEIALPAGTGLGLPGREAGRLSPTEVARDLKSRAGADVEAFRPQWVDYTPHTKVSTDRQPLLKTVKGRMIEPHYGVFGADDRVVYYPSGYPWTCVGRIFVWNNASSPYYAWSGSGVLIGGRVVLTAGHMAPWGSSNWKMQFVPGYYDGASTLGAGVSSWVSDYYGYNTGGSVSAWDMLVCRLYTPLGTSYGYFGAKTYSSSWEGGNYWTLAGYPGAVAGANRPSRQMWWPVLDDDTDGSADELEYEADATAGDSGGPVFGFWSGQPYAIATHSGGEKISFIWTIEDNNIGAGGAAMVNLVNWARTNWP
jgi:V8-like Glu-specific endopeptidase